MTNKICKNCQGSSWTGNIQCNYCQSVLEDGDGYYYEVAAGEFAVRIQGEIVGWGEDESAARRVYLQNLKTRKIHATRNPGNLGDQSPSALAAGTAVALRLPGFAQVTPDGSTAQDPIPWDGSPGTYIEKGTPEDYGLTQW